MSKQAYKRPNSRPYVPLKPSKYQKQKSKQATQDGFDRVIDHVDKLVSIESRSTLPGGSIPTTIDIPVMYNEDIFARRKSLVDPTPYCDMDIMSVDGMTLSTIFVGTPSYSQSSYNIDNYDSRYIHHIVGASTAYNYLSIVRDGTVNDIIHFTQTDDDRKMIMNAVCSEGRADMFDYLVSIGIKPDETCLTNSAKNCLFDRILAMGTPSDNAFYWACEKGNLTNFNKLLYVSDINYERVYFGTPLRAAVENNHTDIALTLLSFGAKPQDSLKYAVENDNEVLVAALIKHGAEVTDHCKEVATPKIKLILEQN